MGDYPSKITPVYRALSSSGQTNEISGSFYRRRQATLERTISRSDTVAARERENALPKAVGAAWAFSRHSAFAHTTAPQGQTRCRPDRSTGFARPRIGEEPPEIDAQKTPDALQCSGSRHASIGRPEHWPFCAPIFEQRFNEDRSSTDAAKDTAAEISAGGKTMRDPASCP